MTLLNQFPSLEYADQSVTSNTVQEQSCLSKHNLLVWKAGKQVLYRSGDLILINNYKVGVQRYPIIAPLKTAGFIVFFMGKDRSSSNERYYAQQFAADYSKVGPEMQISAYAFDANSIP
ncbi:MAG: hypothetical protein AAF770_03845, partial [Bacteroidota bacterium]